MEPVSNDRLRQTEHEQCHNMSFNSPRPVIPLLPREHASPKIHLLAIPFHTSRSVRVVLASRNVNFAERIVDPRAVIREKDAGRRKLVLKPE